MQLVYFILCKLLMLFSFIMLNFFIIKIKIYFTYILNV